MKLSEIVKQNIGMSLSDVLYGCPPTDDPQQIINSVERPVIRPRLRIDSYVYALACVQQYLAEIEVILPPPAWRIAALAFAYQPELNASLRHFSETLSPETAAAAIVAARELQQQHAGRRRLDPPRARAEASADKLRAAVKMASAGRIVSTVLAVSESIWLAYDEYDEAVVGSIAGLNSELTEQLRVVRRKP